MMGRNGPASNLESSQGRPAAQAPRSKVEGGVPRNSRKDKRGTWFARAYKPDGNKYRRKSLGDYGPWSGHDVFAQA